MLIEFILKGEVVHNCLKDASCLMYISLTVQYIGILTMAGIVEKFIFRFLWMHKYLNSMMF